MCVWLVDDGCVVFVSIIDKGWMLCKKMWKVY